MSSDPGVGQPEPGTSVPRSKIAAVLRRDAQLGFLETQIRGAPGYCAFESSSVPRLVGESASQFSWGLHAHDALRPAEET